MFITLLCLNQETKFVLWCNCSNMQKKSWICQQSRHACSRVHQVIVEKVSGSQIVDIDKRKYLVPSDITVAQFMWIIRKRIQLPSEKAIFLFVDKTVPQSRWNPQEKMRKKSVVGWGIFSSHANPHASPYTVHESIHKRVGQVCGDTIQSLTYMNAIKLFIIQLAFKTINF